MPHELSGWTEDIVLLIVKYYCPVKEIIVTLGCYYTQRCNPLKVMMEPTANSWFDSRMDYFMSKHEVAEVLTGSEFVCFAELSPNPKDLRLLNIERSVHMEGLYCGDVIIWQPITERPIDVNMD
ncbi:UBP12, partial [Symbiodinium sp. CCMP2456]